MSGPQSLGPAHEYFLDAWQRSILFFDVRVISATGAPAGEAKRRLAEIETLFGAKASKASKKEDDDVRA